MTTEAVTTEAAPIEAAIDDANGRATRHTGTPELVAIRSVCGSRGRVVIRMVRSSPRDQQLVPTGVGVPARTLGLGWDIADRSLGIFRYESARRATHVYAAIGVLAILSITGWNAAHLAARTDQSRRWCVHERGPLDRARRQSRVRPQVGFATESGLAFGSFAVYQMHDHTVQFQSAHLLPVLLAEAARSAAIAGRSVCPAARWHRALGVLCVGLAIDASALLRAHGHPRARVHHPAGLVFGDSYSEIPTQILLFTAIWLLVSPGVLRIGDWRSSPDCSSATQIPRIDGSRTCSGFP